MPTWVLLIGILAIFGGLVVAIVVAGTIGREHSEISASLEAIEAISGPVPDDLRRSYDKPFKERVADPSLAWLTRVGRTLSGADWTRNVSRRLEMAGNPPGWDADRVLAAKTLTALVLASISGGLLLISGRPLQAVLWGTVFGILGFFIPDLVLWDRANRRSDAIRRALPDSIDLLTISVESGLAFDAAVGQVAHNTEGPLADEFSRVLREMQIGRGRSEALRAMADRTNVEDLRIFLNAMIQSEKLGIPIGDVLRVQAREMRVKRSQQVEEKAMKLPVKLVFPLLFGIMPAMFIVILGPAIISIYEQFLA